MLLGAAAVILVVAVVVSGLGGGGVPRPPRATTAAGAGRGDLFGYDPARASEYVARATVGNAHVLFAKSPGGALATAARVAAYRGMIDRVTAGTGIDPALLEGLVFVESAGRPQVIAGSDPANAAGLTQILAQTGQSLLGMHINLGRSRALTTQIDAISSGARRGNLAALIARRAAADDRFDPARELAATVRYLEIAQRHFGRQDLAFESYHMGIGNLQQVLGDYDAGRPVPYGQLYFDSAPGRHPAAFKLLASFGDDSELYYWRILGAVQIMHLYRTDRPALTRLTALQGSDDAGASALHPPDVLSPFADPGALADAFQRRELVPLPSNAAQLGVAVSAAMGAGAGHVGAPVSLYRGLRPVAVRLLIDLAARVRTLSGTSAPLRLLSTVADERYQRQVLGGVYAPAATGYSFAIERAYASRAQAEAFQAVLDRLQSLDLIAWSREPTEIRITVASDAAAWLGQG
ncbi:MAG TPA: transglycosylase SLT domain-containing protein [Solirubrobacteraceae bacterium]|nr:transglycosylase SLT domain-containing protein [Solirubrobacteraceae bacterium]